MQTLPWDDVFKRTTREQHPDDALRRKCASRIHLEATRLDAAYRLQMEAVSRVRVEEAALLADLVQRLRPTLHALVSPLLLLDTRAPNRPGLVHLRAFLLFGEKPSKPSATSTLSRTDGIFLLDDSTFLRVHFTGSCTSPEAGRQAFGADRLDGLQLRDVLRDHRFAEVADVLTRALATQTARRQAQFAQAQAHLARLLALRVLLER